MKLRYQLYLLKVPEFEETTLPAVFAALPKSFDRDAFATARKAGKIEEPILVAQSEIQEEIMAVEATLTKNGCRCLSVDAGSDIKRFFEQIRGRFESSRARAGRIAALMKHRDARDSDSAHDPEAEARKRMILIGVGVALFLAVLVVLYVLQSRALQQDPGEVEVAVRVEVPEQPNSWLAFSRAASDPQRMQALAAQLQALSEDPENAALHLEVAESYLELRNYVEARASLERAMRHVGDDEALSARVEHRMREVPESAVLTRFLMEGVRELYDRNPMVRERAYVPGTGPVARYTVSLRERHDALISQWQEEGEGATVLDPALSGFAGPEHERNAAAAAAALSVRLGACRDADPLAPADLLGLIHLILDGVEACEEDAGAACVAAIEELPCGLIEERIEWVVAQRTAVSEAVAGRVGACLDEEGVPPTQPLIYGMRVEGWSIGAAVPAAVESVSDTVDWSAGLGRIECTDLVSILAEAPLEVLRVLQASAAQAEARPIEGAGVGADESAEVAEDSPESTDDPSQDDDRATAPADEDGDE